MIGPGREEKALAQLVKIARTAIEERQARLAALEAARASASSALDFLNEAVSAEERARWREPAGALDFTRYLAGAEVKRRALVSTRDTLAAEAAAAREALAEAFAELKKLEHLIEINRRALAGRGQKADAARADDLAIMRRAKR
ncbi:MAG: hypothetical protein AB7P23_10015 [Amphiplicatus sp.]